MSEHKPRKSTENKLPKAHGWMAEYTDEHSLLSAARKVRDSGYTQTDAFTPFPVHGIDEALGIKPTVLPFIVLCAGLTGLSTALLMQWWMNGVDYQYIISGKPMGITPASIPVAFELTILFSAFTSFLGMIGLNGLPKFSNPVFTNPKFDRATDDRFFLYVNAADKYYNRESVKDLLSATSPESLDEVLEDSTPSALPKYIVLGALLLVFAGLIPGSIILNMRAGFSNLPRLHVFFDMDFQPKKKAQQTTTIFADGRTMRPQVKGTVARGQLEEQDPFYLGYDPSKLSAAAQGSAVVYVATQPPEGQPPAEEQPAEKPPVEQPSLDEPAVEAKPQEPAPVAETKPVEEKPAEEKPASVPLTKIEPAVAPPAAAPATQPDPAQPAAAAASTGPNLPWIDRIPVDLKDDPESEDFKLGVRKADEFLKLGQAKFEIYCAACHGYAGFGDGLVHKRADALAQGFWIPPTSLHAERIQAQPVGQTFHTITKGQGKMASYASSLSPKERWAVVLYVKALQRSRNANIEDVPMDQRAKLEEPAAVDKK